MSIQRFFCYSMTLIISGMLISCRSFSAVTPPILPGGINSNFPEESPAYSSDGKYLVFTSDRRGRRDIFLYNTSEKQLISLPNLNHRNSIQDKPAISTDGRYIVYVSTERGKTDVFLYDRQQQKSELLSANIKGSVDNPTISGDGRQIAFQASQLGQWKIVLIER